jgi:hypothetical protein
LAMGTNYKYFDNHHSFFIVTYYKEV